ncbi:cytochrome b/b6 domain-containing protein [Sphingobium sp. H39-3-25]|uniref:YceI family protein n=1 Tax=Sphingobium arseniciresistens TaxID=3030834 RepID=UPI0023B959D9|nr:cytochrome b/b6 domain-containing protein [Sphingobium arseniciresistens]
MTPTRYSLTAIILHWLLAALLFFQISLGWGMGEVKGHAGFAAFQLHKSIGITILVLTLLRIAVRWWKPRPPAQEGGLTGLLAKLVHLGLYVFMLGGPLTGWALVSTAKIKVPTLLFGTVPLPHLPVPQSAHELFEGGHSLIVWIGLALFVLHVAGALRHHLLMRDGLIYRMVPGRSLAAMLGFIALIPIGMALGKAVIGKGAPDVAAASPEAGTNVSTAEGNETDGNDAAAILPANAADATDGNAAVANAAASVEQEKLGPPPVWSVQPGGRLGFGVGNGAETINGSFSRWTAKIAMDPEHAETADIRVEIDLASASVGDATQDGMLSGDDFFGVAAHPRAVFTAKGAERTGAGYVARGTLSLKGVSAPQTIRFTLAGTGDTRTVSGKATITRTRFGVGTGESAAELSPSVAVDFRFVAKSK